MKILFFTKYGWAGASSRYRAHAYLSYLQSHGWEPTVHALLPDAYVDGLYRTGRKNLKEAVRALVDRAVSLRRLSLRQFDVIFVQYELFPYVPFILEGEFYRRYSDRVIVDYDDATFAVYEHSVFLKNKISKLMRSARVVLAGNQYLAAYARAHAREVVILPTVIELRRYPPKRDYRIAGRRPVVGWIGTPVTARHLASAAEAFQLAAKQVHYTLRCIGAPPGFVIPGVDVEVRPWSEATEPEEIYEFDVGVMPLVENSFALGKCGFKLIQYMGCGVPPLGTALGANCEIIKEGTNGYLASSQGEFAEKLCLLLGDVTLRARLGAEARATVQQRYCLDVTAPRLCEVLEGVAKRASRQ